MEKNWHTAGTPIKYAYNRYIRQLRVGAMTKKKEKSGYAAGKNPASIKNLIHVGRPSIYDEPKKKRTLSITESGWQGITEAAKEAGCSSVSEYLERVGRGQVA